MRAQMKDLLEVLGGKYRLTLRAGARGLCSAAGWIYLAEDVRNTSFLRGGELIVTTGLFTKSGTELPDFLRSMAAAGCCGVILNLGSYLGEADLTAQVLEFCDHNALPLLTMPWEVHLAEIMQDYCALFLRQSQEDNQLTAALQSALYQQPVPLSNQLALERFGFPRASEYRVVGIQNLDAAAGVTFSLNAAKLHYHLFAHDNQTVLIYEAAAQTPTPQKLADLLSVCDSVRLGFGSAAHGLGELGAAYRQACFALAAASLWGRPCVQFDRMGLFQLLFAVSDAALLERMEKAALGALEEADRAHGSEYLETLRIFLLSDCNLLDTAARLHTHRNTVVYRMGKIRELIGRRLDTAEEKLELLTAFYIREYLRICGG